MGHDIRVYVQSQVPAAVLLMAHLYVVFGLVYLEAMSRGCITIAARNEGMEGIIENGVNGFLCGAGDAEELASIIRHINSLSAVEKQSISDKAKKKATELSDYNVAKRYIETVLQ